MSASLRLLLIVPLFAAAGSRICAQPGDSGPAKKDGGKEVPFVFQDFWFKDAGMGMRGWAACMAQALPANPCGLICARVMLGDADKGLPNWQFNFDECLPIWHRYLESIRDGRPLPSVERKKLEELSPPDWGMYLAIVQAIDRSHLATLDMFKKSAAGRDHVGFSHLRNKPGQYRGQIITVTGQVTRVQKDDAPRYCTSDVQYVYSTSIQGPFRNEPPFVVLFTELPAGVSYRDKLDLEVTFYGYFLGNVLFTGDPKRQEKDVVAPYLVGRTLIVNRVTPPPVETAPYSAKLIMWTMGGVVTALGLVVLLNFWFRRGDKRIERQLAEVRDKHMPFSVEPAPEPPPLAEPVPPPDQSTKPPE